MMDPSGESAAVTCEMTVKFIGKQVLPKLLPGVGWVLTSYTIYEVVKSCFDKCEKYKPVEEKFFIYVKDADYSRPNRKKQGRENDEKKKKNKKWKPRRNRPPRPPKKHTPGRDHRKY